MMLQFLINIDFNLHTKFHENLIKTLRERTSCLNIGEIHYHKGKQNKWSKQFEFSAESNEFEKNQKWE